MKAGELSCFKPVPHSPKWPTMPTFLKLEQDHNIGRNVDALKNELSDHNGSLANANDICWLKYRAISKIPRCPRGSSRMSSLRHLFLLLAHQPFALGIDSPLILQSFVSKEKALVLCVAKHS